ncbi:hypothetical protein POM88_054534 [Heracleum sosnowskyi]|uniref:Uncharacterized protein n=1 Tax=Heracleum sosnowskyi TaxID=360622 RepID=A0AAD8LWZ0_9APIA|nr:hypothetical protein POM88_054534 [Heracleum sosnowskyi]
MNFTSTLDCSFGNQTGNSQISRQTPIPNKDRPPLTSHTPENSSSDVSYDNVAMRISRSMDSNNTPDTIRKSTIFQLPASTILPKNHVNTTIPFEYLSDDNEYGADVFNEDKWEVGYNAVKNYMVHGPCGKDFSYSPCMSNGKFIRHFPKRYNGHTFFDDSGFHVYRRRKMNRPANGLLRPVSSPMYIILTQSTVIQPIPTDPISPIPMHKFELIQIGEPYDTANLYLPRERPTYAIDIVGQVENLEHVRIIQTLNGEKLMIRFRIHDGRHSVNVAFWDEDVEILDALVHGNFETPTVVILATMRARVYEGSLELRSLSHSRIFINIDYDVVHQLSQRFFLHFLSYNIDYDVVHQLINFLSFIRLTGDVPGSPTDDM